MMWRAFFVFGWTVCLASYIPGQGLSPGDSSFWGYFSPPVVQKIPPTSRQSAMDAMVELTNNLGVAILQDHSYSRGNFAFSPYGVASVLVVLYEGTRGESARQIYTAVGFPADKDIIRVGFRDIHRHLRSYFSHEGYLSGISLNKESSTLRPEYKKILRFYGYDIDLSQDPEEDEYPDSGNAEPEPNDTTGSSPAIKIPTTTTTASQPSTFTKIPTTITSEFQPNTSPQILTTAATAFQPNSSTMMPTTATSPSQPNTSTKIPTIATAAFQLNNSTKVPTTATTEFQPSTFAEIPSTATAASESNTVTKITTPFTEEVSLSFEQPTQPIEETSQDTTDTLYSETTKSMSEVEENTMGLSTITESLEEEITSESEPEMHSTTKEDSTPTDFEKEKQTEQTEQNYSTADSLDSDKSTAETFPSTVTSTDEFWKSTTLESSTQEAEEIKLRFDNGMLIPQVSDKETIQTDAPTTTEQTTETTTPPAESSPTPPPEESSILERNKKSLHPDNNIKLKNNIKISSKKEEEEQSERIRTIVNSKVPLWLVESSKKFSYRTKRTLTDYLKSPLSPDLSLQLQNGMYDTHVSRNADLYRSLPRLQFLVDGAVDTPVPMMTYTNIFPFAYIPRLHAKALEFPLDDIRYKLLILLPVERRGLRQLIYDLGHFPLRNVLEAVRPTRVRAMVPTFMVEGFVILTSSLQKLGIWDVFDPRKANLSGMSPDPELYVRNVEQSVTVVIRNYVEILDIQTRTMAAREMESEFEATHPFLYFILDTATNAALMAGQILDPLNSRIY